MTRSLESLGIDPESPLFQIACTHRSFANEDKGTEHNERLEFLGDAVLELIITEELYHRFPEEPEGKMTKFRSALVRGAFLAKKAKEIGLGEHLKLSKGEEAAGGKEKNPLLADVFEAVLGSIYLDKGMEAAKHFVQTLLFPHIDEVEDQSKHMDPKSSFQEWAQEEHTTTPIYKVLKEEGPDHAKRFVAGVFLGKKLFGEGVGSSKQKAEVAAAQDGIERHVTKE